MKALGALALAAYVVSGRGLESWRYLADVALLVLATNLFNLLDLRPGRAEKALALLGAGLCLGAWTLAPLELLGIFAGPVLVGAWLTLRERAMLGDTGSNLIGAVAGVWLLTHAGAPTARLIALAVGRGTDHLRRVAFDFVDDRIGSAPALARLARQSMSRPPKEIPASSSSPAGSFRLSARGSLPPRSAASSSPAASGCSCRSSIPTSTSIPGR